MLTDRDTKQRSIEPLRPGRPPPRAETASRLAPIPTSIDLGEQIVGSDHWYEIAPLAIHDGFGGDAAVTTSCTTHGATSSATVALATSLGLDEQAVDTVQHPTVLFSEPRPQVEPGGALRTLRVRYAPTRPGASSATLTYRIQWTDGRASEGAVIVHARARHLTEAPSKALADGPAPISAPTLHAAVADDPTESFTAAKDRASDFAAGLAKAQSDGVQLARDESTYQRAAPAGSWWATLAELAISMGVAGVAGMVARQLASHLGALDVVKEAAAGLQTSGVSPALVKDLGGGLTDAIKDGLKTSAKKAIGGGPRGPAAGRSHGDHRALSSDPTVDFWARQRLVLLEISAMNRDVITTTAARIEPLRAADPAIATAVMQMIKRGLAGVGVENATRLQALASETQWVAGISQANHGAEQVATRDGERTVTDLQYARAGLHRAREDGLLHIEVELPPHSREISPVHVMVKHAKLLGVSKPIVDRLHQAPLASVGIPVMITVRGGDVHATITRDEVGRIRVDGELPLGENPDGTNVHDEAQQLGAATMLVDTVLSKDLRSWWELDAIEHDDVTPRGAP